MKREEIDVKLLRYDPFDPKTPQLLAEEYSEFRVNFGEGVTTPRIVCYLILFYDLNTQLRVRYPDINRRKSECAKLADFKGKKDGKFEPAYEDILVGLNNQFNEAQSVYVRSFGRPEFMSLHMFYNMLVLEEKNSYKISASSAEMKQTIANITSLRYEIDELSKEIYGGEEAGKIRAALYRGIERDRVRVRPEDIAKIIDEPDKLKEILGDFYAKDVEQMRFIGSK